LFVPGFSKDFFRQKSFRILETRKNGKKVKKTGSGSGRFRILGITVI
jgi:hypothetical protein